MSSHTPPRLPRTPRPLLFAAAALAVGAATALPAAAHAGMSLDRPRIDRSSRMARGLGRRVQRQRQARLRLAVPRRHLGARRTGQLRDRRDRVQHRQRGERRPARRCAAHPRPARRRRRMDLGTGRDGPRRLRAAARWRLAVEARLQLPNRTGAAGRGYWPAFWMLGAPYRGDGWSWPGIGEIDIMENVQGLNTDYGTFHCGTAPGGDCNEKDGRSANTPGGRRASRRACTPTASCGTAARPRSRSAGTSTDACSTR